MDLKNKLAKEAEEAKKQKAMKDEEKKK